METAEKRERPLSPHLQIYKPQITSVLSILHRATGMVLYAGTIFLALWFLALSEGPTTFNEMQDLLLSPLGILFLMGWSFSFFYHLCNGLRHLMWDMGSGFDMPTVRRTGWAVIISTAFLTLVAWGSSFLFWEIWG